MNRDLLQFRIGIFIVMAHFTSLIFALSLGRNYLLFDQTVDLILTISPMFSVYTIAVVRVFIKEGGRLKMRKRMVNGGYVFVSLFFPLVFSTVLLALLVGIPLAYLSFEQVKRALGVTETIFGIYLSLVIGNLFTIGEKETAK